MRDCAEGRDAQVRRSQACAEHRCAVDGCPSRRQNEDLDRCGGVLGGLVGHAFCARHGCQSRSARCASLAMEGSRFCKRHTCAVQDCPEEARVHGNKLCSDHALTRQERIRDAARGDPRVVAAAAGVDPAYQCRPPVYGVDPGIVVGGGMGYGGFGMPPVVPGGGMMPGVGYQYGPGQTRYHYQFP